MARGGAVVRALPNPRPNDAERRVLECLADGMSDKRIAREIGSPLATVTSRVRRLMAKAGADNRTHLLALAIRRGWIEIEKEES